MEEEVIRHDIMENE